MTMSRRGITFDEPSLKAAQRKAKAWGQGLSGFVRIAVQMAPEKPPVMPNKLDKSAADEKKQ